MKKYFYILFLPFFYTFCCFTMKRSSDVEYLPTKKPHIEITHFTSTTTKEASPLLNLPSDVLDNILSNLPVQSLATFAQTSSEALRAALPHLKNKLKDIAEDLGYGYKYSNLIFLNNLTMLFNKGNPVYRLEVPSFVGIPSQKIQGFFSTIDFNISEKWADFVKQYLPENKRKEILANKKFPDGFEQVRANFESQLRNLIDKKIAEILAKKTFSFDDNFKIHGADDLIRNLEQKQGKLMVRSSGKEDTQKLANAGGNISVANVVPDIKDILESIKDVVLSYFSQKSLTQRLGAGDETLFDPKPFTPVLLQKMIGETDPNQLPKCGVMFTEEPEGGISKFEQKNAWGKIITTKITLIQSAYGHNEGVVNSLIPVDTYYVDEQNNIYSVIRAKTHRMVPRKNMPGVELQENTGFSVINFPALDQNALLTLKNFANTLEYFYGYPMDVEFVVSEQEKTIYIVQARPIVHNPNQTQAAYLSNTKDIPTQNKISGSAIGVAGGALHWVTDNNQIILAADIGDALREYQSSVDRTKVEAVIVGKMAPATSHEATTFRGELKPVIFIPNWQTVQEWLKDPSVKLVVSPQQGIVVNWKGEEKLLQDIFANKKALMGWNSYPVPKLTSVTFGTLFATDFLTKESLQKLFAGKIDQSTLSDQEIETADFAQLLESVKNDPATKATASLALLMFKIEKLINQKTFVGKELTKDKNLIGMQALEYAKRIFPTLQHQKNSLGYPRKLFAIRFLESLILQQPAPEEIIGGLSLINLLKDIGDLQKIGKEFSAIQKIHPMVGILFVRVKKLALTDELAQNWEMFITMLAQQDKQVQSKVIKLLMDLAQFNLLPVWINTSFYNTFDATKPVLETVEKLLKEFFENQEFIKELTTEQKVLESFNTAPFADPKTFQTQWDIFNKEILTYFLGDAFIEKYKKANGLARLAAGSVMHKLVDTFDTSIKTMTGSTNPEFSKTKKVEYFQLMLMKYAELFKKWAINILTEQNKCFIETSKLEDFIIHIDKVVNKTGTAISTKDLEATHGFDVQVFTIGSGAWLPHRGIQAPITFEDIFTMIHQCLLRMLSIFCLDAGGEKFAKPNILKKVENVIAEGKINGTLISSEFLTSGIKLTYNVPLRSHSVLIELYYDYKNKSVIISPMFFGQNGQGRWTQIGILVKFLDYLGIFKVVDFKLSASMISFGLVFDQNSKTEDLTKYLNDMIDITFNFMWKDFDLFRHLNLPKGYPKILQLINESELFDVNFLINIIGYILRLDASTLDEESRHMLYSIAKTSLKKIALDENNLILIFDDIFKLDHRKIDKSFLIWLYSWIQNSALPNIKDESYLSNIIIDILKLNPASTDKDFLRELHSWVQKTALPNIKSSWGVPNLVRKILEIDPAKSSNDLLTILYSWIQNYDLNLRNEIFLPSDERNLSNMIRNILKPDFTSTDKDFLRGLHSWVQKTALPNIKDESCLSDIIIDILKLNPASTDKDFLRGLHSWVQKTALPNIKNESHLSNIIIDILKLNPASTDKDFLRELHSWVQKSALPNIKYEWNLSDIIRNILKPDFTSTDKDFLRELHSWVQKSALPNIKYESHLSDIIIDILKLNPASTDKDFLRGLHSWVQKTALPNIKYESHLSDIIIDILKLNPASTDKDLLNFFIDWLSKTLPQLNNPELEQQFKEWKAKIPSTELEKK